MHVRARAPFVLAAAVLAACQNKTAPPRSAGPAIVRTEAADARPAVAPAPTPSGDIEFRAVLDLAQAPKAGTPELRGAREAVSVEWPASLYTTYTARGATATCTAALVGPSALLTAAHCVPAVGGVTFTYGGHASPYVVACTRHPDYGWPATDASADFALCTVSPAFAAPDGFRFETVSTSDMSALVDRTVMLPGFGCVSSAAPTAPFDGRFRIGFGTIDSSSTSAAHARGDEVYAPNENNNLFTTADLSTASMCTGDSGGPVFAQAAEGAGVTDRAIVGVSSRVFYLDGARTAYGSSLISATGSPAFRAWAARWTRQTGAAACGITGSLADCRS